MLICNCFKTNEIYKKQQNLYSCLKFSLVKFRSGLRTEGDCSPLVQICDFGSVSLLDLFNQCTGRRRSSSQKEKRTPSVQIHVF